MHAPNAKNLLDIWDAGRSASPSQRSLLLLASTFSDERDVLANIPLGELNARLLRSRAQLFGPDLNCLANCPQCSELVETTFGVDEILSLVADPIVDGSMIHSLTHGECKISFRLPNATDLLAIAATPGTQATNKFIARLIDSSTLKEKCITIDELPAEALEAVERQIVALDPLAHIELSLTCPDCLKDWLEVLHVIDFLWQEIGNLANHLLLEVARLASAFGWSEQEILALSPERRRSYLGLLEA